MKWHTPQLIDGLIGNTAKVLKSTRLSIVVVGAIQQKGRASRQTGIIVYELKSTSRSAHTHLQRRRAEHSQRYTACPHNKPHKLSTARESSRARGANRALLKGSTACARLHS